MGLWQELNDFSEFDKKIPCILCKGDSVKTIVGNHWKCSKCDHLFNENGSNLSKEIVCYCEVCKPKEEREIPISKELEKKVGKKKKKK
jgi:ribosomal protein L37AE/L43A